MNIDTLAFTLVWALVGGWVAVEAMKRDYPWLAALALVVSAVSVWAKNFLATLDYDEDEEEE